MAFLTKLLVCFCLTALAVSGQRIPNNRNLVAVVQLFRHGQRVPGSYYTNDPYSDKSFWGGLETGQLTNEGKRQHYRLGQFTRRRYNGWLPNRYVKNDFYAYTTDVDRTHMSAQSNLNGLYPARGDQVWRPFSDWQAIPVHPIDTDILNAFPSSSCTNYYTEYANVLASDELQALNVKYADVFTYLTEKTGDNITTFTGTHVAFDCLKIENDVNLPLPRWAASVYPNPLTDLAGYYFESYSHNTLLQRLGTGLFLNTIVEYFEDMAEDDTSSQRYIMYSAHDFNIASVLNSLGAYSPPYPPQFASSIYLELRNNSGNFYVNAFSKNGDDFKQISIQGCALNCPLSEVKERLGDILVDADTRSTECTASSSFVSPLAEDIYKKVLIETEEMRKELEA